MEAETVFTTVSLMMLGNGAVLVIVSRDLPALLRPAAKYWQIGTMLIAAGCAVFALGAALARPAMLIGANALMTFGLSAYHVSVQRFSGIRPKPSQLLPPIIAIAGVFWFSVIVQHFQMRVVIVSAVWAWLMAASIQALLHGPKKESSLSRRILTGIFALILIYVLARAIVYLLMGVSRDFAVESGTNWLNMLSPILMTLLPVVGTTAFLLMCSDNLTRQLETAALTDYLTGLPNRRAFAKCGTEWFCDPASRGAGFAVAILDIDNFKAINDTHGHDVGDQILAEVADRLRMHANECIMIARTGGEEFAILLKSPVESAALDVVERLRLAVAHARFGAGAIRISVTLSAGIAVHRSSDHTFDDVVRRADQALYSAKAGGRNRIEISKLALVVAPGSDVIDSKPRPAQPLGRRAAQ
jgi:diguanylate cyclase (GGDEF)-like protein